MGNSIKLFHKRSYYDKQPCNNRNIQIEMLITGYSKDILHLLPLKMIPSCINTMLLHYYIALRVFYYIDPECNIFSAKCDQRRYELYDTKQLKVQNYKYTHPDEDTGMFLHRNHTQKHDIIYKCGGIKHSRTLPAELIPSTTCNYAKIYHCNDHAVTFNSLPSLPQGMAGNCVLYDEEYGLLSIGGYTHRSVGIISDPSGIGLTISIDYTESNSFYNLSMQTDGIYKWVQLPDLCENTCFASGIIINTMSGKKMVIIGGMNSQIFIFDFNTNKWIKSHNIDGKHSAKFPGICYNILDDMVYMGVGIMTCAYNLEKNQYYDMFPYGKRPLHLDNNVLWIDDRFNNLLFSAEATNYIWKNNRCRDYIAYIDLRCKDKWYYLDYHFGKRFAAIQTSGDWTTKIGVQKLLTC
eukprot:554897_1